ncbi:MAG: hypothetical protein ACO326_09115 [Burkholderiaceae bacterium]
MKVTVSSGDTLLQLTRQAMRKQGVASVPRMPFSELMNRMTTVAQTNAIKNPDLIFPGQVIDFTPILGRPLAGNEALKEKPADALAPTALADRMGYRAELAKVSAISGPLSAPSNYRVLERTLDRAVSKGYLPQADVAEVRRRILDMAKEHRFMPDDFARVALIESDGLNPRATNGNCHGIIQFCDGPDRGAASVGYGRDPKAILEKSVVEQLDLVDRYFQDTSLKQYKPASLEALYLTVLYPAARDERQMHRPLPIPGKQASVLHVGGHQANPITLASLRKGLIENAQLRLNQFALDQSKLAFANDRKPSVPSSVQQGGNQGGAAVVPVGLHSTSAFLSQRSAM